MAIKAGFYGAPCYDLINYVSRILTMMEKSVLMIDMSADQSLTCSIPLPDTYDGSEYDYRNVTFSLKEPEYMGMDYDIILYYFGLQPDVIRSVDYMFFVSTAELHVIADIADLMAQISIEESSASSNVKRDVRFLRNTPNVIALGPGVDLRFKFIAQQLNIPRRELVSVDMDENAMLCRLACQYDNAFRFQRLSADYRELLYRICSTLCDEELDTRMYRKALKLAERGR